MAKRKRDYEEFKQFMKLANRDDRFSKSNQQKIIIANLFCLAGEYCGYISEKICASVNTSSVLQKEDILPATTVHTTRNRQVGSRAIVQHSIPRGNSVTSKESNHKQQTN